MKNFKTTALYNRYKTCSAKCKQAIDEFVTNYENRLIEQGNVGSFYRYVNKKLNGSNNIAPLRDHDGNLVYTDDQKATLLNEYFSSIYTGDNGTVCLDALPEKVDGDMPPVFFTPDMVNKYIRKLNGKGSGGPDGLPAVFFKNVGTNIAFPLSVIFNISVQSGSVPSIWRSAVITPAFKKGSPSDPANYRPISLTCIACKLLECGIKDALLKHMLTQWLSTWLSQQKIHHHPAS